MDARTYLRSAIADLLAGVTDVGFAEDAPSYDGYPRGSYKTGSQHYVPLVVDDDPLADCRQELGELVALAKIEFRATDLWAELGRLELLLSRAVRHWTPIAALETDDESLQILGAQRRDLVPQLNHDEGEGELLVPITLSFIYELK